MITVLKITMVYPLWNVNPCVKEILGNLHQDFIILEILTINIPACGPGLRRLLHVQFKTLKINSM